MTEESVNLEGLVKSKFYFEEYMYSVDSLSREIFGGTDSLVGGD